MSDVKPTRSELLKLNKKIKLASSGHSLLKRKQDGLIHEFFEVYEEAKKQQTELSGKYKTAKKAIAIARAVDGTLAVRSAAQALRQKPEIGLETKNIMGVVVPEVEFEKTHKKAHERGYGLYTSPRIDEVAEAYEEVLDEVVEAAGIQTTMKRLLLEIEKTKRRVNALEFVVIPRLEEDAAFIRLRLEEMERENIFRLKRIKKRSAS